VVLTHADTPLSAASASPADAASTAVTLTRGLSILEVIASSRSSNGLTHAAIALRMGMSRSTLYRYLSVLVEAGFLEADELSHRYRLGARVQVLAASAALEAAFAQRAIEYSRMASDATGEQSQAMVLSRGEAVTIAVAPVSRTFRLLSPRTYPGATDPIHCSGCGKLFLAWESDQMPAAYFERAFDAHTESTITDPDVLLDELDAIRRQGFAVDQGEHYEGIACVAVPVFDAPRHIAGALAVVLARGRLEPALARDLADKLRPIGRRFSHDLATAAAARRRMLG
jgi:IclR family transcriptional regulator, KDG regulon repressor